LEALRQGGAAFVVDLVRQTGLPPSQTRAALWRTLRKGVVTNDRFDDIRRGEEAYNPPAGNDNRNPGRGRRRMADSRPEGRWSLVPWGMADTETRGVQQAHLLLDRYGIVARELAQLDPSLLPWRVLYEVLSRMEWAGQVRRGYFIEGLSGAQFGDPEAVAALQKLMPKQEEEPVILLHSQDPANVHGSGLLFDLPFAAQRRSGNWIAVRGGQPKFWFEQNSKRITTLPSARPDDLALAAATLTGVLRTGLGAQLRGKLVIETWDGQPVTQSVGREPLEAAGFVRDYQAMTLYAGWS
jgi:ATP-dependent helicase Lhr and Lhr-like helicase